MTPRAIPRRVAIALFATLAVHAAEAGDTNRKRREPPDGPPLVVGALQYEAPRAGRPFGFAQDGGVVVARRADTGDVVWARRVPAKAPDPHMDGDKQDVFIKSLALSADGRHLAIVDERGQRFEMGLDGCGVRAPPWGRPWRDRREWARGRARRAPAMSPDADDLMLFARVAESGSFSRAAERVQLPKSTVSRRIAALEKRLGERLLQRTTRKLVITEFGQGVLDHARALSEEVDAALAFALSRQARPSGRLRVSMPGDFASTALERPLAAFIRDFPEVSLELDLSPRRVDLIGENFDLAIRMGTLPDDTQLTARRLAVFTTGLYAAPSLLREHGEPLTPDALHTMPALMLLSRSGDAVAWELSPRDVAHGARADAVGGDGVDGSGDDDNRPVSANGPAPGDANASAPKAIRTRRSTDAPLHEIVPRQHVRANSPDVLIRLARSGAGVVAVADFFAEPYLARGELQRILPAWCLPDAQCWAVFPGRRLMPAKTRAFIDMLARTMSTCSEVIDASAAKVAAAPGRFRVG